MTDWYRIDAKAKPNRKGSGSHATIYLYAQIGDADFLGQVSARDFVKELQALDASNIELRLNSPGGNAWDGIAIYNSLRSHKAKVTVHVDGMAASAASLVAMAGDEVVMSTGSQMMMHDPQGLVAGPKAKMLEAASALDKMASSMADVYAAKAGGDGADWRPLMAAETWFTADEAVEAKLADRVDADTEAEDIDITAQLDADPFRYAGRDAAPAPQAIATKQTPAAPPADAPPPAAPAAGATQPEGAGRMDQAKLRESLGLESDASDEDVRNALAAAGYAAAPPAAEPPAASATGAPIITDDPEKLKAIAASSTTVIVDRKNWEQIQEQLQDGVDAAKELRSQKREALLDAAETDGRIPHAARDQWTALYDKDPKGTTEVVENLTKNVVPVAEMGWGGDVRMGEDDEDMGPYASAFPPGHVLNKKKARR